MRIVPSSSASEASRTGWRKDVWYHLVNANGGMFATIALGLLVVNTALIWMLKQHASKDKIKILIWWSVTFTFTYGLRSVYQFLYSARSEWFT